MTTEERGRFYIGPHGHPHFAGSASGVFFADRVQGELVASPVAADGGIERAFFSRTNPSPAYSGATGTDYDGFILRSRQFSNPALKGHLDAYFEAWHPILPFLDGAALLEQFDKATSKTKDEWAFDVNGEEALILSAIFLAVFAMGGSPDTCGMRNAVQASTMGYAILGAAQSGTISDMSVLQGLLAVQLYLFSIRALRPAMHLGGSIIKLACDAGLHRCPGRYVHVFPSEADREMRKRVFYSIYVLDRVLSAEFGLPIMLSDRDMDTCLPGATERHTDASSVESEPASKRRRTMAPADDNRRLLPAQTLADSARIMGEAMEAYNKLVKYRPSDPQHILNLRVELDSWWNDMGLEDSESDDPRHRHSTLFTCIYHNLLISLHRPALSRPKEDLQHAAALQATISSARTIITTLSRSRQLEPAWPGYVGMTFFSCLVLVYADRRAGAETDRLARDLTRALGILEGFANRWDLDPFLSVVKAFIRQTTSPVPQPTEEPFPDLFPPDLDFDLNAFFSTDPSWSWPIMSRLPTPTFDAQQ